MKADLIIPTYRPDDTFCLLLQKLQEQTFVVHRVLILNTEEKFWKKLWKSIRSNRDFVNSHVNMSYIMSAGNLLIMVGRECMVQNILRQMLLSL